MQHNTAMERDETPPSEKSHITNISMGNITINIGDVVSNRYKVISEIAQTALSAIYIAEDTRLNRKVALKHVFKKSVTDDFKSLIREAHLLSTMSHPNVLTVYDCTADDKGTYIISEYLNGDTLEKYRENNDISIEEFISLAEQLLLGLSEAHKQGIVHGDIKPNNIIILNRANGKKQLKLLDFGLSRIVSDEAVNAGGSLMEGSAYFMSPEEFNGTEKNVLSDIYSLGCLCYFTITGQYPFEGDNSMQIMAAHIQHKLHLPSVHRPDLPDIFEQWIMWLINLRPEARPRTVGEAQDMLAQCVQQHKTEQETEAFQTKHRELTQAHSTSTEWANLRNHALRSLSKLLNKQHAIQFMTDTMAKHGYHKTDQVPKEFWRLVITDFYASIPNRSKQAALLKETEKYFSR